jgi:hypothetical protein
VLKCGFGENISMPENPVFKIQELTARFTGSEFEVVGRENPCTPQTAITLRIAPLELPESLKNQLSEELSKPG